MAEPIRPTWFITGASSGFGLSFAEYALGKGYNVVATGRSIDKLSSIKAPDTHLLIQKLDVTVSDDAEAAVQAAVDKFGRIDVLINNAGFGIVGAVEETPDSELRAQMETNFFGAVNVAKAVLPVMRERNHGAIVNISSLGGQLSAAGFGAYSASKFALEGLSEALALEVAPFGIKVLIVEPGAFRTNFAGYALKHMPTMPVYQASVGVTREFARGMAGTQEGDPAKAAAAIDMALRAETTPLRLQLGVDSIDAVRNHAEKLLKDLTHWEAVGLDTRYEGA